MYGSLIKPILFRLDPETAHDLISTLAGCCNFKPINSTLRGIYAVDDPRLRVSIAGLEMSNPIGLAAGFDKNVGLYGLWRGLGFGHIEFGTVTPKPQTGNPKPRIFRLSEDRALINRMGFPSAGKGLVKARLQEVNSSRDNGPIIGINIGKNKATELDKAVEDYTVLFSELYPLVDYVTVNISSPNTPGLRELQERGRLMELLGALQGLNRGQKPIFVKVAPDLSYEAVEELLQCCVETRMAGVIATNTTLTRDGLRAESSKVLASEVGGLSGEPLFKRSLDMVRFIARRLPSELALIGVGGVLSVNDAAAMLAAGARAIQVYTGLVYNGPGFVKQLNLGLLGLMARFGAKSLEELGMAIREQGAGR